MTAVILQPAYLPWLGVFDQMRQADVYVFLDTVQLERSSRRWENRNRIKGPNGVHWLTVPIEHTPGGTPLIRDVRIAGDDWQETHMRSLRAAYGRTAYYDDVASIVEPHLAETREDHLLADLNIGLLFSLAAYLRVLPAKPVRATWLSVDPNLAGTARLVAICQAVDADHYLASAGSAGYIQPELFADAGISLRYHAYQHPTYEQPWGDFVSHLSVVDLLCMYGPESRAVL